HRFPDHVTHLCRAAELVADIARVLLVLADHAREHVSLTQCGNIIEAHGTSAGCRDEQAAQPLHVHVPVAFQLHRKAHLLAAHTYGPDLRLTGDGSAHLLHHEI